MNGQLSITDSLLFIIDSAHKIAFSLDTPCNIYCSVAFFIQMSLFVFFFTKHSKSPARLVCCYSDGGLGSGIQCVGSRSPISKEATQL